MPWVWKEEPVPADDSGLRKAAPADAFHAAMTKPKHRFRRWLLYGAQPEPVPSHLGMVEPAEKGKLGVCCSGGGIRSAAFSLGALQELQREGELRRASYLAAVSGGSYIAAAISMVAKTGKGDSDATLLDRLGPFAPGSPEEQYLRNRCSYLAPTIGDKIYLGWRVVLGLLINLVFLSLPIVGLALVLAGTLYALSLPGLAGDCNPTAAAGECVAHVPLGFWTPVATTFLLSVAFGLATLLPRWKRERWERFFTVWSMRLLVVTATLALLLVAVPYLVEWVRNFGHGRDSAGAVTEGGAAKLGAGVLVLLAGVWAQLAHLLSSDAVAKELGRTRKFLSKLGKAARRGIAYAAAALIGPLLFLAIFVLAVAAGLSEARGGGRVDLAVTGVGFLVLILFAVIYRFADLTTWSLNPYYKRRLSTAFSLKRIGEPDLDDERGEPDRVEALAPADPEHDVGIAVERDFDELVPISMTALRGGEDSEWPTLLVCAAANVSDSGATPPGRHVTSFTFSATTAGGPLVGAVRTWELENAFESREEAFPDVRPADATVGGASTGKGGGPIEDGGSALVPQPARKRRRRDLTLPAAMAISGAAISPSMGKMTRRPLTFLMALANIRLGVWVPNPRWIGTLERSEKLRKRYVRPRPFYLLCELLGRNRIGSKYLYVTDGGHYENLGLVELLRRGCTEIYCLDASGVGQDGAEFEALGEAIALARSELGVEIEFDAARLARDPSQMTPDEKTHMAKRDVVTARIVYPPGENGTVPSDGKLVYVRNTMTAAAPWDVRAHHELDPRFPNNPTVDQLYTDQKFEAYRVLGAGAATRAVKAL